MITRPAFLPAILSMSLLAACGGSSDPDDINSGPDDGNGTPSAAFQDYLAAGDELAATLEALGVTPSAALPTTGTANYSGLAGFRVDGDEDPSAISTADFVANFETAAITGSFTKFEDASGDAVAGSLSMTGDIDTSDIDSAFTGTITGSLTVPDGDITVNASVSSGRFRGDNGEALSGLMTGTIDGPEGLLDLEGEFVAER